MEAELFGDVNGAAAGQQGAAERDPGTSGISLGIAKSGDFNHFSTAGIRIRKSLQLQGLRVKKRKLNVER